MIEEMVRGPKGVVQKVFRSDPDRPIRFQVVPIINGEPQFDSTKIGEFASLSEALGFAGLDPMLSRIHRNGHRALIVVEFVLEDEDGSEILHFFEIGEIRGRMAVPILRSFPCCKRNHSTLKAAQDFIRARLEEHPDEKA